MSQYTDADLFLAAYKVLVTGKQGSIPDDDEELALLIAEQAIIDKHGPLPEPPK